MEERRAVSYRPQSNGSIDPPRNKTNNGPTLSRSSRSSRASTSESIQDDTPRSPSGRTSPALRDRPLPSIERDIEALELNIGGVAVSRPSPGSPTASVNGRFEDLRLSPDRPTTLNRSRAAVTLSPEPQNGTPSNRRSRPRSSSRNQEPRHEVDQEPLPDSKFYQTNFQDALALSKDLAKEITDALSNSDLHTDRTSDIYHLYNRAKDAVDNCSPKIWKIGFVGDSGQGEEYFECHAFRTE